MVSWGFDVPRLIRRLSGHRVYHAHSSGYGFALPEGVPVLAVSRNTLGYWGAGRLEIRSLCPMPSSAVDRSRGARAPTPPYRRSRSGAQSSDYVLTQVVPALRRQSLTVEIQSGWVDDLVGLFNCRCCSRLGRVLAGAWREEGFGSSLEAMACGCVLHEPESRPGRSL